jgi:hypothetical protein
MPQPPVTTTPPVKVQPQQVVVQQVSTGIESVNSTSEIALRISELNNRIEANNKIIKDQNEAFKTLKEVSIVEDEEYVKKYLAEKKSCLDRVDEYIMRDICNQHGFKHLYQAKIIKLILESIYLIDTEREITKELEDLENFDKVQKKSNTKEYINKRKFDVLKKTVFHHYKVNCYDAWRFKNIFLAKEDFVTANYTYFLDNNPLPAAEKRDGKEVVNKAKEYRDEKYDNLKEKKIITIDDAHEVIKDIRRESVKFEGDKDYEEVFAPLIDALQVMLFLKIVKTRLDNHRDELAKVFIC